MRKIIIIIAIILSTIKAYSQHPFDQNLNNVAKITFPDTPKAQRAETYTIYMLKKDDLVYLAEGSPMNQSLRDLFLSGGLDSIYNGFIKGFVKSSNGKLLYKTPTNSNGLDGVEFECIGFKNDQKYYTHNKVFFFNNSLIDYSVLYRDSLQKNDKRAISFFDSFKLTINKSQVRQDNSTELGYRAGTIIGLLIVLTVILTIGGLFIFLIIKLAKRSTH